MTDLALDATNNGLTYQIIGKAMSVHNKLGPGYKEEVYEKALFFALNSAGIETQRQHRIEVWSDGNPVSLFMLDLFVQGFVIVEIKAFSQQLGNDELAQVLNYLKASQSPVALLFNFGRRRLEYKRIFPGRNIELRPQRQGRDNVKKGNTFQR